MKKLLLTLMIGSLAYAQPLKITKSETFEIESTPNLLSSQFTLSQQSNTHQKIEANFAKNNQMIRSTDICKGGSFQINPRYRWDKSEKIFLGYEGYITYKCEFEDIQKYHALTSGIILDGQKISLGKIEWIIDDETKTTLQKKLQSKALKFSISYAAFLSKELQKTCTAIRIDFEKDREYQPMPVARTMALEAKEIAPIKEEKSLFQTAIYEFECN